MIYFIRTFADLSPEHFQAPRRADSVRRSIDGTLCVVAFDPGTAPLGWHDGMSQEEINAVLASSESLGIWYTENDT